MHQATTERIRRRMFDKGLTVNRLADEASIPRMTLTRRLNAPATFTLYELDKIAGALDVDAFDLIHASGPEGETA